MLCILPNSSNHPVTQALPSRLEVPASSKGSAGALGPRSGGRGIPNTSAACCFPSLFQPVPVAPCLLHPAGPGATQLLGGTEASASVLEVPPTAVLVAPVSERPRKESRPSFRSHRPQRGQRCGKLPGEAPARLRGAARSCTSRIGLESD